MSTATQTACENIGRWGGDSALYHLDPPLGVAEWIVIRDNTAIPGTDTVGAVWNVAQTAEVFAVDDTGIPPEGPLFALFQFSDIHIHADVLARFGYQIESTDSGEES